MKAGLKDAKAVEDAVHLWKSCKLVITVTLKSKLELLHSKGLITDRDMKHFQNKDKDRVTKDLTGKSSHVGFIALRWFSMLLMNPLVLANSMIVQGMVTIEDVNAGECVLCCARFNN